MGTFPLELVGQHVLNAEAGAPVGAQVARVQEALPVGLHSQRPRVRRRMAPRSHTPTPHDG
jgi:hypothetical protein